MSQLAQSNYPLHQQWNQPYEAKPIYGSPISSALTTQIETICLHSENASYIHNNHGSPPKSTTPEPPVSMHAMGPSIRSQPIEIQTNDHDAYPLSESLMQQKYDEDTWRMYNRIQNSRLQPDSQLRPQLNCLVQSVIDDIDEDHFSDDLSYRQEDDEIIFDLDM